MSALAWLAGLWLAAAPPPAAPPVVDEPAIGRLLIANRQVTGFFGESVIVLVDHGTHGSLGLVVNRPVEHTLAEILPDVEAARGRSDRAWLGGPVAPDQLLLLIRAKAVPEGAAAVLEDVSVSGSRDTLRALLEHPRPGVTFRAYVGYAGWAPGQLAGELERGDWTLAPGDAASVFTNEPAALWETLLHRHQQIRVQGPRCGLRIEATRGLASCEENAVGKAGPAGNTVAARAKSITLRAPWRSAAASSACRTSERARSSTR